MEVGMHGSGGMVGSPLGGGRMRSDTAPFVAPPPTITSTTSVHRQLFSALFTFLFDPRKLGVKSIGLKSVCVWSKEIM